MADETTYPRFGITVSRSWGGACWHLVIDKTKKAYTPGCVVSRHKSRSAAEKGLAHAERQAFKRGESIQLPKERQ